MDIQPIGITRVVLECCGDCGGGEDEAGEDSVMHGLWRRIFSVCFCNLNRCVETREK